MDVFDFHKDFLEEVKTTAATSGEGSSAAFVNVFSDYLLNAEVLTDFTYAFYTGNGRNNRKIRVDGYFLDEFDFTMNLILADYSGDENREVLTKTTATQLFERMIAFIDEVYGDRLVREIEASTPVYDLVELMRFHKLRIRKYRLILLTDGFMSDRINTLPAKNIVDIPVECQIWDIDRLYKVCFSEIGRQKVEIDFKAYTQTGIPCLEACNANDNDYKSYLCIIPGETLADIYDHYGSQLLESNVRSFLSTKVAVNKKIRETILRIPQKFFAYNNGISPTAVELKIESSPEGKFITYAKDFQIVNGGQTTASLSNSRFKDKADLGQILVQMKLTDINSNLEEADDLIRNISRSSNSQNKVSEVDFFSSHPFHIRMEQISRRLYAPAVGGAQYETKWFYERARGQYLQAQMHMSKSEKDKFVTQNPKKQVITKTDMAKIRNSWRGLPHTVSRGAQSNFIKFAEIIDEDWINSDKSFNDLYYKKSVALMILFKQTEQIISHQPWYENGYRANIATYTIALLHFLIGTQFPGRELDLMQFWNRQEIPAILNNELVKITKKVFEVITDPKREIMNVTQWCKKDTCWVCVKKCGFILSTDIEKLLLNMNEVISTNRDAERNQQVDSDVEAQKKVLSFDAGFWEKLNNFITQKGWGSPDSDTALRFASQIPNKLPTPYQSIMLLKLLDQAESEGFKA